MLVLGTLLIMSTLVIEFAYNTHVAYELAASERDGLKAYYLARSAMNLIRLELRLEKGLRAQFASFLDQIPGGGVSADPLCKQIPMSTELLKGLSAGMLSGKEKGEEKKEEGGKKEEEKKIIEGEIPPAAQEFLSFDGDFEVTCDTEERKINLNVFSVDPTASAAGSPYYTQKDLLFSLLTQKDFEPVFHGKPDEARKVVNAIADWADRDDRVNEDVGIAGGSEDADYGGAEYHTKVKNGKYATVAELLLVAGVGDDLYQKLAPQVTVYGDNKIYLCQASDEMIRAFVMRYLQTASGVVQISPTDEEKWGEVIKVIQTTCSEPSPTPQAVAGAIAAAVGGSDTSLLAKQLTTTNRFYRIESTGRVGESTVRLVSILDTGSSDPNLWKTVYFREE